MENEITDEKLEYLTQEVIKFYSFANAVGQSYNFEPFELDYFVVTKLISDFYEKNATKYNNSQIVYQFFIQTLRGDKATMEMYREYKRLKADM